MGITVQSIADIMETYAPAERAMAWDNVGLLVGHADAAVTKVLVALDVTAAVIAEAVQTGATMIVTHHPVIFKGAMSVTDKTWLGRNLLRLVEQGIAVYSAHTNLDVSEDGTNDTLCARIGLENVQPLIYDEGVLAIGRHGFLTAPQALGDFAAHVKQALGLDALRVCGDENGLVRHVAVCAGAGGSATYIKQVKAAGCDVYITADIGFHAAQDALADGLFLIDATHYASEAPVVESIKRMLETALRGSGVTVAASKVNGQVFMSL